jgi:hypothetical protein
VSQLCDSSVRQQCARDSFARTALILIITCSPGQDSPDIDLQVINIITAVRVQELARTAVIMLITCRSMSGESRPREHVMIKIKAVRANESRVHCSPTRQYLMINTEPVRYGPGELRD